MENKNKSISDELLIAYIEGNLSKKQSIIVENAISEDNILFSRYAILNKSYQQLNETNFEVTPDSLKERLNQEFGIKKEIVKEPLKLHTYANELLNKIFNSTPILATVMSVFLIMLIIFNSSGDVNSSPQGKPILNAPKDVNEFLKRMNNQNVSVVPLSSDQMNEGIMVSIKNDTLVIKQTLSIARKIYVINMSNTYMHDYMVNKKINKIQLNPGFQGDSVRVIIESFDSKVFDDWLKMK